MFIQILLFPLQLLWHVVQDDIAPNVMAMVKSFNRLALLVPTEILEETTPQGRAKVISKYIKVRGAGFVNISSKILKAGEESLEWSKCGMHC